MDRLDDMAIFVRVVDCKSFTQAAERLGLSKSVVSRRLTELENRLGARLMNRTTRRLSLTEVGQAFYDRAVRILSDVDEAEGAVGDHLASPRGKLRINAPVSFGTLHLAPAIAGLLERFPEMEVEMDLNDRYVDLVDEGFDVAVRIGRLRDSSLIARRIAPNRRAVIGSPGYFARRGRPAAPEDLLGHNCLIYTNTPVADQWTFRVGDEVRSVKVSGCLRANNGEVLLDAVRQGIGLAIMPTFLCGPDIAAGRVETALDDCTISESAVYAVYPHGRHLSPKVRVFVDFLADRFGPVPCWDRDLAPMSAPPSERTSGPTG